MISKFSEENKEMKIGEFFTFYFTHTNEWRGILDFQREYYPEFKDVSRTNTSIIFQKVR